MKDALLEINEILGYEYIDSKKIEKNKKLFLQLFAFIKTDKVTDGKMMLGPRVKLLYEKWIANVSEDIFEKKVLEFSRLLKVILSKVIIKNLKNRWGSATEKGIINLKL